MPSISKTINGIVCQIDPAVLVNTAPNGDIAEFTSPGTQFESSVIRITCDRSIIQFSITLLNQKQNGHIVRILDSVSNSVVSSITNFSIGPQDVTLTVPDSAVLNNNFIVQLLPVNGDKVYYRNISMVAAPIPIVVQPPSTNGNSTTPIGTTFSDSIDLSKIIVFSDNIFKKTYTKGTLDPIASDVVTISNLSNTASVDISIDPFSGISITPSKFSLPPVSSIAVSINYDPTNINSLPDGTNTFNVVATLTSTFPIISVAPIFTQGNQSIWYDGTYVPPLLRNGYPPANWVQLGDGSWVPQDAPPMITPTWFDGTFIPPEEKPGYPPSDWVQLGDGSWVPQDAPPLVNSTSTLQQSIINSNLTSIRSFAVPSPTWFDGTFVPPLIQPGVPPSDWVQLGDGSWVPQDAPPSTN